MYLPLQSKLFPFLSSDGSTLPPKQNPPLPCRDWPLCLIGLDLRDGECRGGLGQDRAIQASISRWEGSQCAHQQTWSWWGFVWVHRELDLCKIGLVCCSCAPSNPGFPEGWALGRGCMVKSRAGSCFKKSRMLLKGLAWRRVLSQVSKVSLGMAVMSAGPSRWVGPLFACSSITWALQDERKTKGDSRANVNCNCWNSCLSVHSEKRTNVIEP